MSYLMCDELGVKKETVGDGDQRRIKLIPDPVTNSKNEADKFLAQMKVALDTVCSFSPSSPLPLFPFPLFPSHPFFQRAAKAAEKDKIRLGEVGWKSRYYERKFLFPNNYLGSVGDVVKSYVEGLCWVMKYYYQGEGTILFYFILFYFILFYFISFHFFFFFPEI